MIFTGSAKGVGAQVESSGKLYPVLVRGLGQVSEGEVREVFTGMKRLQALSLQGVAMPVLTLDRLPLFVCLPTN